MIFISKRITILIRSFKSLEYESVLLELVSILVISKLVPSVPHHHYWNYGEKEIGGVGFRTSGLSLIVTMNWLALVSRLVALYDIIYINSRIRTLCRCGELTRTPSCVGWVEIFGQIVQSVTDNHSRVVDRGARPRTPRRSSERISPQKFHSRPVAHWLKVKFTSHAVTVSIR